MKALSTMVTCVRIRLSIGALHASALPDGSQGDGDDQCRRDECRRAGEIQRTEAEQLSAGQRWREHHAHYKTDHKKHQSPPDWQLLGGGEEQQGTAQRAYQCFMGHPGHYASQAGPGDTDRESAS